jgi:hypothetical protein
LVEDPPNNRHRCLGNNEPDPHNTAPGVDFPPVDTGITVLQVLIIAALCIGLLNAATFAVEAWRGTLDTYALRSLILKAAFGLALIGYVLRKIKNKKPL